IVIKALKFDTDTRKSVNSVEFDKSKKVHYKLVGDYENRGALISKVFSCNLLNNKDLAMITNFGLFICQFVGKLLEDYIEDKRLLRLYWQELLNCFFYLKNYSIVGEVFSKICKKIEDDKILLKLYG
ncbi:10356_t:CDS:2, partial [Racocetra fulgida]